MRLFTYQTVTTDEPMFDVLYAGDDLEQASQAALAYAGTSRIDYYTVRGTIEPVQEYENGQATRGYVNI